MPALLFSWIPPRTWQRCEPTRARLALSSGWWWHFERTAEFIELRLLGATLLIVLP